MRLGRRLLGLRPLLADRGRLLLGERGRRARSGGSSSAAGLHRPIHVAQERDLGLLGREQGRVVQERHDLALLRHQLGGERGQVERVEQERALEGGDLLCGGRNRRRGVEAAGGALQPARGGDRLVERGRGGLAPLRLALGRLLGGRILSLRARARRPRARSRLLQPERELLEEQPARLLLLGDLAAGHPPPARRRLGERLTEAPLAAQLAQGLEQELGRGIEAGPPLGLLALARQLGQLGQRLPAADLGRARALLRGFVGGADPLVEHLRRAQGGRRLDQPLGVRLERVALRLGAARGGDLLLGRLRAAPLAAVEVGARQEGRGPARQLARALDRDLLRQRDRLLQLAQLVAGHGGVVAAEERGAPLARGRLPHRRSRGAIAPRPGARAGLERVFAGREGGLDRRGLRLHARRGRGRRATSLSVGRGGGERAGDEGRGRGAAQHACAGAQADPAQGDGAGEEQQQQAEQPERLVDLRPGQDLLVAHAPVRLLDRAAIEVHQVEVLRADRQQLAAPGRVHHLEQERGVELAAHRRAVVLEVALAARERDQGALAAAEPDREHAHAQLAGQPRGVDGVGLVVLAVGDHQDVRVRLERGDLGPRPARRPWRLLLAVRLLGAAARGEVVAEEVAERLADRVANVRAALRDAARRDVAQGRLEVGRVRGQRAADHRVAREQDQPDPGAAQRVGQARQLELGVLEAVGPEVVRQHGAADVEAHRQVAPLAPHALRLGVGAGLERREQERQQAGGEQPQAERAAAGHARARLGLDPERGQRRAPPARGVDAEREQEQHDPHQVHPRVEGGQLEPLDHGALRSQLSSSRPLRRSSPTPARSGQANSSR